jgi:3,4-dihydroxy 2-butanone 4-phosphate synthase/GTP cyclohydrolase II
VTRLSPLPDVLAALAAGRAVVVLDDTEGTAEGHLVFAASLVSPGLVAFAVRHGSGFVRVALTHEACRRLRLPPMTHDNENLRGAAYTVTVDAAARIGTGISARDRATTIRVLADPASEPGDLTRPGHVLPLQAAAGGVLERAGRTEAAVDLMVLAGLAPAGVTTEIISDEDPAGLASGELLARFCLEHGLVVTSVAAVAQYRSSSASTRGRQPDPGGSRG